MAESTTGSRITSERVFDESEEDKES